MLRYRLGMMRGVRSNLLMVYEYPPSLPDDKKFIGDILKKLDGRIDKLSTLLEDSVREAEKREEWLENTDKTGHICPICNQEIVIWRGRFQKVRIKGVDYTCPTVGCGCAYEYILKPENDIFGLCPETVRRHPTKKVKK